MTRPDLAAVATDQFCYLTTRGRVSGKHHEIEIWFATDGTSVFMISGGGDASDWVKNLLADPACTISFGGGWPPRPGLVSTHSAFRARLPLEPGDERYRAAHLLHAKYGSQVSGSIDEWLADAYFIAFDWA